MKASPLVLESALWALIVALSLNIGAVIGVSCLPGKKLCAALMAFGGGAFLFALSVEIFGRTLHEAEKRHDRDLVWVMESCAILGGCIFAVINYLLNSRGADLRKRSLAKVRFVRMRRLFIRRLVERMRKLKIFSDLTPAEVSELVISSMEKMWFPSGDVVLEPTDALFNIYFIVSGRVSFESVEQPSLATPGFERFELGPDHIFGEMLGRRATALAPTKLLKIPAEDLARLMENSATVRDAMAGIVVQRLQRACGLLEIPAAKRPEQTSFQIFRINEKVLHKSKMESVDAQCICFGKVEVLQSGFPRQIFNATQILRRSDLANPDGPVEVTALELTAVLWLQTPELQALATKPRSSSCPSGAIGISGAGDANTARLVDDQGPASPIPPTIEVESVTASDLESGVLPQDDLINSCSLDSIHKECGWLEHMSEASEDPSVGRLGSEVYALEKHRLVSDGELEERDLLLRPLEKRRNHSKMRVPSSNDRRPNSKESGGAQEVESGHVHADHGNAAVMVWLGILIDSIPESVVIGILVNRTGGSLSGVLPFSVGLFMSNLPESMCSSGLMRAHGMRTRTILLMWSLISLATVIGSVIGALAFPPGSDQEASTRTLVAGVEGLAGGAMLTMIAQTMMPEAFEQGGDVIGLSCLAGFLCALSSKLLPV